MKFFFLLLHSTVPFFFILISIFQNAFAFLFLLLDLNYLIIVQNWCVCVVVFLLSRYFISKKQTNKRERETEDEESFKKIKLLYLFLHSKNKTKKKLSFFILFIKLVCNHYWHVSAASSLWERERENKTKSRIFFVPR